MALLFFEHFRSARESLRRTRSRTLLTILGIAIGVGSITAILALGGGLTNIINRQVAEVGNSIAIVRPEVKTSSLLDFANPTPQAAYSTSPITERDYNDIQKIENVETAVPLMTISGGTRSRDANPPVSTILATTPDFIKTTPLEFRDGQFIDTSTLESTAVIGYELSLNLFRTNDAVGKIFSVKGQRFTVIGVMKKQNNPINYNNVDLDHAAIISLTSGKLLNQGIAQIQQINVKAKPGADMNAIKSNIQKRLNANHEQEADVAVLVGEHIATPTSRLLQLINGVMGAIAGISLLVGGIGVMNIMLVGVSERTREIGLRKAVGASNRSIVQQFMVESIMLGVLGGVVGFVAGYSLAFIISLFLPYDPVISWQIAAFASVLSIGVGTIFGVYPAYKAAKKHPIESLRRLH
jgi:putative ABC transport system permease protein